MKRILAGLLLVMSYVIGTAVQAENTPLSPELQKLDISVGRWVFHGETLGMPFGEAGTWSWNEYCRWSDNQVFLLCSFANVWSGKNVKSLVVDTYNRKDRTYWHYELFSDGETGSRPFISKMSITGNTWTEYGQDEDRGKKISERIVYHFASLTQVGVEIQVSRDGTHWITSDRGKGVKQP